MKATIVTDKIYIVIPVVLLFLIFFLALTIIIHDYSWYD